MAARSRHEVFGKRFSQALSAKGWTQREAAAQWEVTQATISHWSNGKFVPMTPEMLLRIADDLGVTMDYLYGRERC